MQIYLFSSASLKPLDTPPAQVGSEEFVWFSLSRDEFDLQLPHIQAACARIGSSMLLDMHVQDLASESQPTTYDATSVYDLVIFRRLAMPEEVRQGPLVASGNTAPVPVERSAEGGNFAAQIERVFHRIDTRAVGFAVFDRMLVTVHPPACPTMRAYVQRLLGDIKMSQSAEIKDAGAMGEGGQDASAQAAAAARTRVPQGTTDLALRLIGGMVDSYLGLRQDLSGAMEQAQTELLKSTPSPSMWAALMQARRRLQMLQDMCEDQQDTMQEWIETLSGMPQWAYSADPATATLRRDLVISRARDVMEHIDRVLHHARRLEQAAETGVQIHFSAQSQRTNTVMQTLTAVTIILLPLNFFTGFFGMNFEHLPLIHSAGAMWSVFAVMCLMVWAMVLYFLRRRLLEK